MKLTIDFYDLYKAVEKIRSGKKEIFEGVFEQHSVHKNDIQDIEHEPKIQIPISTEDVKEQKADLVSFTRHVPLDILLQERKKIKVKLDILDPSASNVNIKGRQVQLSVNNQIKTQRVLLAIEHLEKNARSFLLSDSLRKQLQHKDRSVSHDPVQNQGEKI